MIAKYDGLQLGYVSKAPIYDHTLDRTPRTDHKILVRLILGGLMRVWRVRGPLPGEHARSRIGANAEYHYVLRRA